MNYKVKIKALNKMFIIKEKPVRSPFECIISENQLHMIHSRIKFYGLQSNEYDIELLNQNTDENQKKDYDYLPSAKQPDKEEKTIKRNSPIKFQDKFEDKIIKPKPIQKNIKREEKLVHQKQESVQLPIIAKKEVLDVKKKVYHDPIKKLEQNINVEDSNKTSCINVNELLNNDCKNVDSSDVEVKIEELAIKSSSILEKFLNSEL